MLGFGIDNTRDNALYNNGFVISGSCELCPRKLLESGNLTVVRGFDRLTLGILNYRGKNVGNVCLCSFVNVNSNLAVLSNDYLNAFLYVDRPFDRVLVLSDHNLVKDFVIGRSFLCFGLHYGVEVFLSVFKTGFTRATCKNS